MTAPPLKIAVYDKDFIRRGLLGNPKFVTVIPRHNAIGKATVALPSSHRMIEELMKPGARIWIRDEDNQHLMSGYVGKIRGTGPAMSGQVEFDIDDDFIILSQILGWVQPAQPITSQGIAGDNWVMTSNAENVLKTAVTLNGTTRLGLPLTCATNLNRGSTITAKLRFHPLFDRIFPVIDGAGLEASGIGVTVRQKGTGFPAVSDGLELDVYVPAAYPRALTEKSGVITSWGWSFASATATRVVVGGQGEAQARVFRRYEDAALEAGSNRKIERFRDARDVDDVAILPVRGQETIDEGGPKSGLSVTLSQTKNFRYGHAVSVGDTVVMEVGPGVVVTDVLKEATLSWTADAGWSATPKVGERSDDSDTILAKAVRALARVLSNQNRT